MEEMEIETKKTVFLKLLPMKVHYLLMFGGNSASFPYIFTYAKQLGITADVLGYIIAGLWCFTVLSRPILGGIADQFQKFKLVLLCMLICSVVANLGLSLIPQPQTESVTSNSTKNSSTICHQNNSYFIDFEIEACETIHPGCNERCSLSCFYCEENILNCTGLNTSHVPESCNENVMAKCTEKAEKHNCSYTISIKVTDGNHIVQNAPLQTAMLAIFAAVFFMSLTTNEATTDAACAKTLGDKMEIYGKQRMWGTIGWGSFSLLAGYLNHVFSVSDDIINYKPGFYLAIVFYTMDMFILWKLQLEQPERRKNVFKDVGWLLLKPRIVIFILQVTAVGIIRGIFTTYYLWYLESLGASALILGSVTSFQCFLGEVPFFFLSGWIIKKMGYLNVFTMSFVAHGLRFLAYSYLVDPIFALAIEVLQGPSYGSFFAALTSYVKLLAPKGAEATVQAVSLAALEGIGMGIGSLLGGHWVENIGGQQAFFYAGILSIVFGIFSCIANGLIMCNLIK